MPFHVLQTKYYWLAVLFWVGVLHSSVLHSRNNAGSLYNTMLLFLRCTEKSPTALWPFPVAWEQSEGGRLGKEEN